jgi:hypothetical protein
MADIIRKKKSDAEEKNKIAEDLVVHADTVVPSLISRLVDGQLKKITSSDTAEKKQKHSRSKSPRRRSRSRSRERY